jgi:uncharacterized protein
MAARDIRKNFNLFVNGQGYAGQVETFSAPKLTQKTEEFRAGGMNGPIKLTMGMEAMDAEFVLSAYDADVLALFGVVEGNTVPLVAREVLESYDGTITAVVHTMRAKVTAIDPGESKPGEKATLKVSVNLPYYKLQHGSNVVQEIDLENMALIVNGTDLLAATRTALGM